jgi:hypothetical protein
VPGTRLFAAVVSERATSIGAESITHMCRPLYEREHCRQNMQRRLIEGGKKAVNRHISPHKPFRGHLMDKLSNWAVFYVVASARLVLLDVA